MITMYINSSYQKSRRLVLFVIASILVVAPFLQINKAFASAPGSVSGWGTTTSLPSPMQATSSVQYNGYIYTLGGGNQVLYSKINADGSIGSWTISPNNLPQVESAPSALAYNGYLYSFAGQDGVMTNTVYYAPINIDGSIGTWVTTTALPNTLNQANVEVFDGYVYYLGGNNNGIHVNTIYTAPINANGSIGTWATSSTPLPIYGRGAATTVFGGYLYYITGGNCTQANDGGTCYQNLAYSAPLSANGGVGTWTQLSNVPPQGVFAQASTVQNGYIFTAGGMTSSGLTTTDVVYSAPLGPNGTIGTWSTQTHLPVPLYFESSVAYNGNLYIIGGTTNGSAGGVVDTVYYTTVYGALAANAPTTLGPTSLTNNSYNTTNQPTFTFSQSDPNLPTPNVQYQIEVSANSDYSSPVIDYESAFGATGSASFTVGQAAGSGVYNTGSSGQTLLDGNYYWRVRTINSFLVASGFTNASSGSTAFKIDATAPTASTLSPTNNATGVALNSNLTMNLSEPVYLHAGNITIYKASDNSVVESISATSTQVTGNGTSTLTINPSADLTNGTSYYVRIDAGAITDVAGNNLSGFNSSSSWQFTAILTPQQTAINKIHDYAVDSGGNPAPTVTDYATAGASGVTSGNLGDVNVVVAGTNPANLTTANDISQVVAVPVSTDIIIDHADTGGSSAPPVLQDYINVGVTGVTGSNLGDINEAVASSNATDLTDIQTAANKGAATSIIKQYAASGGISTAPTLPNYQTAGITGVTSGNLGKVNGAIASAGQISTTDIQTAANEGVAIANAMNASPNSGDANGDGTQDSQQNNVMSFVNNTTQKYTVVTVDNTCTLINSTALATTAGYIDNGYDYHNGLVNYTTNCGTNGYTTTATIYQYGTTSIDGLVLRKYDPSTHKYSDVPNAKLEIKTIGGQSVAVATYSVTDGGALDTDGQSNSVIIDPVGLASKDTLGAPNTGLVHDNSSLRTIALIAGVSMLAGVVIVLRRRYRNASSK